MSHLVPQDTLIWFLTQQFNSNNTVAIYKGQPFIILFKTVRPQIILLIQL